MHHTQPPFVRLLARSLARQCSLTAHHWGGKGRRRHRRRRKCAILNHHSFARSLIRSLANSCLTAHHWGGRVLRRATLHHRSPACSPIHVSRLITEEGGSPLGNEATQVTIGAHYWGGVTGGAWRAPRPGRRPGWRTPRRGRRHGRAPSAVSDQGGVPAAEHHWSAGRHGFGRRHKCTILNHHSLARQCALTAHHWGGVGSQACHAAPSFAR